MHQIEYICSPLRRSIRGYIDSSQLGVFQQILKQIGELKKSEIVHHINSNDLHIAKDIHMSRRLSIAKLSHPSFSQNPCFHTASVWDDINLLGQHYDAAKLWAMGAMN